MAFGAFPLHGTVQYGSLLGGFPLSPVPGTRPRWYHYQNMTCKLYWSLIGRRKSSLLCHWTCDMRPNIDLLDLNPHSQQRLDETSVWTNAPFCINQKIAVSLSVEEVQMFLSLIAEEWIQLELNEKVLYILFALCIFLEYFLFIFLPFVTVFCFN